MRGWSDGIIPLAAAGLALLVRRGAGPWPDFGDPSDPGRACARDGRHRGRRMHGTDGVTATVIDADAQRIAVLRGDGAGVHTLEASWGKAYAAVGFAPMVKLASSGEVATWRAQFTARQPPGTHPFQPPEGMILRAGGLTIKLGEEVIGAIGVGGAPSAEADEVCACAGLDKIRDRIR